MTDLKNNQIGKISIIIPCRNAATTLPFLFASLLRQHHTKLVREIIIIDDNSTDNSKSLIGAFKSGRIYPVQIIIHRTSRGLAGSYNEGLDLATGEFIILMHADVVLVDNDAYQKMIEPLNDSYVVSIPTVLYPRRIWDEYNFWQKCLFSRFVDKKFNTMAGKFDCYRRALLLSRVGLFDDQTFRTAGEDTDMQIRLRQNRLKIARAGVEIIHLHSKDVSFGLADLIRKEAQYAEAAGASFRKHGFMKLGSFNVVFFREIILLSLLVPIINLAALGLILIYAFVYTRYIYLHKRDCRVMALPFVNIYLLFVHFYYSTRGYIYGRQRI